jgi:hypothetical protein
VGPWDLGPTPSPRPGCAAQVLRTEGVRGFWKGNAVNIMRTAPFKGEEQRGARRSWMRPWNTGQFLSGLKRRTPAAAPVPSRCTQPPSQLPTAALNFTCFEGFQGFQGLQPRNPKNRSAQLHVLRGVPLGAAFRHWAIHIHAALKTDTGRNLSESTGGGGEGILNLKPYRRIPLLSFLINYFGPKRIRELLFLAENGSIKKIFQAKRGHKKGLKLDKSTPKRKKRAKTDFQKNVLAKTDRLNNYFRRPKRRQWDSTVT